MGAKLEHEMRLRRISRRATRPRRPAERAIRWLVAFACLLVPLQHGAYAVPPLTDEQIVRLETAHDGRDHQEEAFMALVENLGDWDGAIGDTPVRLEPHIVTMLDAPDRYRGELVRLIGHVAQVNHLPQPHERVVECFIRDATDRPLLVYVVVNGNGDSLSALRERRQIEIYARFYKSVRFTARDGRERSYAAFVGAHPRVISPAAAGGEVAYLAMVSTALLVLLVVFVVLIAAARRRRRENRRSPAQRLSPESVPPELDDTTDLPDDPAEALTELHRRMHHADH